jgi:hypothetical protein
MPLHVCTQSTHILRTQLRQIAYVQSLLKMGEQRPKHVDALTLNRKTKKSVRARIKLVMIR